MTLVEAVMVWCAVSASCLFAVGTSRQWTTGSDEPRRWLPADEAR